MPSATATMFLNVSAIQAMCAGTNGTALRYTSGGAPSLTHGASGDFTFDISNSPLYYDLYGPKTITWPTTAIRLTTFTQITAYVTTLGSTSGWRDYLSFGGTLGQGQLSSLRITTPSTSTVYPLEIVANNKTLLRVASTGAASLSGGWYVNYPYTTNLNLPFEDTIKTGTNSVVVSGDAFFKGAVVVSDTTLLSGDVIFGDPSIVSTVSTRKNLVYDKDTGFLGVGINWSERGSFSSIGSVYINGGPGGLPVLIQDSSLFVASLGNMLTLAASGARVAVNVPAIAGLQANLTVGGSIKANECTVDSITGDTFRITTNTFNAQTGTTYLVTAADNGKILTMSNATSAIVAIPAGLGNAFKMSVMQLSVSAIYLSAYPGVTLNSRGGLTQLAGQYAQASIVSYTANTYLLAGDLV